MEYLHIYMRIWNNHGGNHFISKIWNNKNAVPQSWEDLNRKLAERNFLIARIPYQNWRWWFQYLPQPERNRLKADRVFGGSSMRRWAGEWTGGNDKRKGIPIQVEIAQKKNHAMVKGHPSTCSIFFQLQFLFFGEDIRFLLEKNTMRWKFSAKSQGLESCLASTGTTEITLTSHHVSSFFFQNLCWIPLKTGWIIGILIIKGRLVEKLPWKSGESLGIFVTSYSYRYLF